MIVLNSRSAYAIIQSLEPDVQVEIGAAIDRALRDAEALFESRLPEKGENGG